MARCSICRKPHSLLRQRAGPRCDFTRILAGPRPHHQRIRVATAGTAREPLLPLKVMPIPSRSTAKQLAPTSVPLCQHSINPRGVDLVAINSEPRPAIAVKFRCGAYVFIKNDVKRETAVLNARTNLHGNRQPAAVHRQLEEQRIIISEPRPSLGQGKGTEPDSRTSRPLSGQC